ncbi:MAG: histidinol-phosphate transaminase [Thermoflexaceae bacterium]|nr:histidinol-phosphate transaminase [Thermoflexaceae bacterium]
MYQHGGDIYSNNIKLDFSVNLNPLGMPQSVRQAIAENINDYETYPDYSCRRLRRAIAAKEGVEEEDIICGNGAAELIYDVVRAVRPSRALILAPAFSEYEKALHAVHCDVDYFFLKAEQNFTLKREEDAEVFLKKLDEPYDMVFLCNPNNPAGSILKYDLILEIIDKCAVSGALTVLDECFIEFTREESFAGKGKKYPNLFLIKAFTKTYSMAGVRLGYAISSNQKLLSEICSIRQCWNVSAIAQAAGVAALLERDYLERTREYVDLEREYLRKELINLGFNVIEGAGNFLLFSQDMDKITHKVPLYDKLLERHILIRKCDDYKGMNKGFYRIGIKSHGENEILIGEIKEIVAQ